MKATLDNITEKIAEIECTYAVDSISLDDGTKLWNLIRVILPAYTLKPKYFEHENKNKMKKLLFLVKETLSFSKLPQNVKICGVSDADAQKKIGEHYYDVFMDPLNDVFSNFYVLDWPSAKAERYPAAKNHIPLQIPLSIIFEKLLHIKPKILNEMMLNRIIGDFAKKYGLEEDRLSSYVFESVSIFKKVKKIVKRKMKKMNPSIVFIRSAIGRFQMGVVQTCKELKITTIELQHGLIYDQNMMYIKKTKSQNRDCIPDMIFTWGDFFSEILYKGYLFEKNNIKTVGFPHIENLMNKNYPHDEVLQAFSKKFESVILVSGQERGNIDVFIKKAAKINKQIGYIYKPHPRDVKSYNFEEKNILLIDRKKDVCSLFASVDIHMTVVSSTMMEALAFGVPNILVASDEVDIDPKKLGIIDYETTYYIHSPEEIKQTIDTIKKTRDIKNKVKNKAEIYFKKDALKNIERETKIITMR